MTSSSTLWTGLLGHPFNVSFVDAGGWRTRVLGAGSGPPLVMLHGTGGHAEAFARNLVGLGDHAQVFAPDFAGHGFTTLTERDLEIGDYVDHVIALLDRLELDAVHLSGESLGGWVAARLAARHPDRVQSLILNTPGGTMANDEVMARIRELSQAAADDPSPERIRTRLEWLMADPASVTDELVAIRRAIYSQDGFSTSMRHLLCLQDPVIRRRNLLITDELNAITAPTLVVWTSHDPSGPAAEGRVIADAIADSEFALIDDAGHWPQWEQVEQFDRLVVDWVRRHDRGDQP